MTTDQDGMQRVDIEWSIETRHQVYTGNLYGLHEQERLNAVAAIMRRARRGDTVTIKTL